MSPPNVVRPAAYSFSPVRPCLHSFFRVCPETLLTQHLAEYLTHFTKLTSTMHYGTEMDASQFGIKRSKVKFTVE